MQVKKAKEEVMKRCVMQLITKWFYCVFYQEASQN